MAAINYTITNIGNTSITSFTFEFVTPVQVELHADFSTIKSGESSDFTGTSYTISDLDLLPSSTASFSIDYTYLSGSIGTYNGLVTVTGYNSTGEKVRTVTTEITIVTPMILVYDTTLSPTTEIQLPLNGTVNVVVDWGDGNTESVTTAGNKSHTYATNGTYTVSITGSLTHFGLTGSQFVSVVNPESLISVVSWGSLGLTNLRLAFNYSINLTQVPTDLPSTVTNLAYVFNTCTAFNQNINSWNVTNVTNMEGLFLNTDIFNQPLNSWNVSNVTTMELMFTGSLAFNQPLNSWNVSNVTTMKDMFGSAEKFNQPLNTWDVSNVTDMDSMFAYAYDFNQNISNWCVTLISSEPPFFSASSSLTAPNKPVWGTCPP